jgi:hypothetical protein
VFIPPEGAPTHLDRGHVGRPRSIPVHIVAAIRWDYEQGLMPMRDLMHKWHKHASAASVQWIAYGKTYRDVVAAKGEPPNT